MRKLTIRDRTITDESDAYVVAELSHSHNGSQDMARHMIRVAAECGADAVKLQKRSPAFYAALREKGLAEYADLRESRELTESQYWHLKGYAHDVGLAFIVTAFDLDALEFVTRVGVDAIKIASGTLHNDALLEAAGKARTPIMLSTGCADEAEATKAAAMASFFAGESHVCLMQCTSQYPCPPDAMHLRTICAYRAAVPRSIVGLSSHALDNTLEPVAYAFGARVFEKHFTLSRALGPGDHAMSLDPAGLKDLVEKLRATKAALGTGVKRFLTAETEARRRLDVEYEPGKAVTM